MDIRSAAAVASQPIVSSGQSGSAESAVAAKRARDDSFDERKEVERADPGSDRGSKVDIDA